MAHNMFEILSVLIAGTFWFWVIMAFSGIVFLMAVKKEKYFLAVCTTILLAVLYHQCLLSLPWQTWTIGVPVYLVAGALWSIFSWHRLVVKKIKGYQKSSYLDKGFVKRSLAVKNFQSRVISWIALWPFSVSWYFVRHLLGDLFKAIYDNLEDTYNGIMNRAVDKAIEDKKL